MKENTNQEYYNFIIENKNNYLTEKILGYYLNYLFHDSEIIHDKIIPNSGIKNRPDYRIEDLKLIVEFDGYKHFTSSNTILADIKKDKIYSEQGYKIIRIQYWIQLNDSVLYGLFNEYLNKEWGFYEDISSEYPLGFIDKKALLPADYSEFGLDRYYKMYLLYSNIVDKLYKYHDFTLYYKCFYYDSLSRVYNFNLINKEGIVSICYLKDDMIVFQGFGEIHKDDLPGICKEIEEAK